MPGIKKLLFAFSFPVFLVLQAGLALGWQFEMTGSMNWAFEYYNQTGGQGFFGPYNVDNGAGTTTANLNYWWSGRKLGPDLVTGRDATVSWFYVEFDPRVKINDAVKLTGRLRLGQWLNPQNGQYFTWDALGTDNAFSEGQWTMFWATVQLPWGTLGVGKRPWKFGTGLQYDGSDGLSTESLLLNAPYGPLDIGIGFYPHRPARRGQTIQIDPYDLIARQYFNHADKSGVILNDLFAYVVYAAGPLQAGILGSFAAYHIGPEGPLELGKPAPRLAQDSEYCHGTLFSKYNNGRFFLNAEAAWLYWIDRLSGSNAVNFLPAPRYTKQWRYMVELGAMAGPAKLSFLSAWLPGPDRRNSALIDRQSAAFVWHPTFDVLLGNYDVFRAYSFLLRYNYGSGFNAYNLSVDGYMRDAWVLATRLDYAAAANLNLYTTFLWAERTANGYGWACIAPNDAKMPPQFVPVPNDGNLQFVVNGAAGSPNIPDRALGWEIEAGFDWQILEGFTFGFLAAYWQPGKWFSFACIDRAVPAWNVPTAGNNWGTNPGRTIDPLFGGQCTMNFSF